MDKKRINEWLEHIESEIMDENWSSQIYFKELKTKKEFDEHIEKQIKSMKREVAGSIESIRNMVNEPIHKNTREMLIKFCEFLFTEMNYTTETNYEADEQVDIFLESYS